MGAGNKGSARRGVARRIGEHWIHDPAPSAKPRSLPSHDRTPRPPASGHAGGRSGKRRCACGAIERGMAHQGFDLQLTRYDERGWRATFYTTGMDHSACAPIPCPSRSWVSAPGAAITEALVVASSLALGVASPDGFAGFRERDGFFEAPVEVVVCQPDDECGILPTPRHDGDGRLVGPHGRDPHPREGPSAPERNG